MKKLIAYVMAGGKGTRMGNTEKPLILVCGKPIIERIVDAIDRCDAISDFFVVVTETSEFTSRFAKGKGWKCVFTEGRGYLADAWQALQETSQETGVFVSSDLPFLTSHILKRFIDEFRVHGAKVGGVYRILEEGGVSPVGINILRIPPLPAAEFRYFTSGLYLLNINASQDVYTAKRVCECQAYSES